jgi:hypothetical protein
LPDILDALGNRLGHFKWSTSSEQESMMTVANVSKGSACSLPEALRTAQAAIHLPEVQEMLCRLSKYKLGIFMPHAHDEQTGEFQPLPDNLMQVESGLGVSFRPTEEIANQTERFLPVGWCWRAGASTPVAACEMASGEGDDDTERYVKHKMIKGN